MTSEQLAAVLRDIETEAEAYVSSRKEATLVVGLTVRGDRQIRTFRSPDATQAGVPTETTMYEIGSVSKVFSTTVLALLEGQGVIGLDDPIVQHLPQHLQLPDDVAAITIRQLATHTSGLGSVGKIHDQFIAEEMRGTETPFGTYTHYLRYRKEHLYADLESAELVYPTGQGWTYSVIGMGTLGHILELASGRPYEELLTDTVCTPLGLHDTSYTLRQDQRDRMMFAYDTAGQPLPNWYHDVMMPQGGLRSTLADLLTFVEANLAASNEPDGTGSSRSVPADLAAALRRTREVHAGLPPEGFTMPDESELPDYVQGLAWRGLERADGWAWYHPGTTLFYLAEAAVDARADVGMAVISSARTSLTDRLDQHAMRRDWFERACRAATTESSRATEQDVADHVGGRTT